PEQRILPQAAGRELIFLGKLLTALNKEILTQAKVAGLLGREERTAWPARYYGIAIDHNDAVFRLGRLFARIDLPHAARNLTPLEHHHVGIEHFHDNCRTAAAKHLTIRFTFTSLA